jgi:hypothetical protein
MDCRDIAMDHALAVEDAEQRHDASGAMNVLDVPELGGGGELGQMRRHAREPVDVLHGEGDLALEGGGQQMQYGVGRAAHGDVEPHGVLECLEVGDRTRQHRIIVLAIMLLGQLDDTAAGLEEELAAVGVRGEDGAVARQ